jgi:hypothetical protein
MVEQNFNSSLLGKVPNNEVPDVLAEVGEVVIDDLLQDGVLKDLPVLGTALKLYKAGVGIREFLFIRKLCHFLLQLRTISAAARTAFEAKLRHEPAFSTRVGENLLILLERLDDMGKPEFVGKVFRAYILEHISYEEFTRLATAIERAYLTDLLRLDDDYIQNPMRGQSEWHQRLAFCGLMRQMVDYREGLPSYTIGDPAAMTVSYERNELNRLFVAICLLDEHAATPWLEGRPRS